MNYEKANFEQAHSEAVSRLHPAEGELGAHRVYMRTHGSQSVPGAMVLTRRRLIFVGEDAVGVGAGHVSMPFASIAAIDTTDQSTTIVVSGRCHSFLNLPDTFLRDIHKAASAHRASQHPTHPAHRQPNRSARTTSAGTTSAGNAASPISVRRIGMGTVVR